MANMSYVEALELVKLRIKEDGVSWAIAFDEYKQLTGSTTVFAISEGKYLQKYAATLKQ